MKFFFVFIFLANQLFGAEFHGVVMPETHEISGQRLSLNGFGLRSVTMLNVHVYVAAFYSPIKMATAESVFSSTGPFRFDVTFLRSFKKEKVEDAWRWQFQQSNEHFYPAFSAESETFVQFLGPIKKGGRETFEIEGEELRVYDENVLKGKILGRDFQKAFLSIWFGEKPVMPSLKKGLLGTSSKGQK